MVGGELLRMIGTKMKKVVTFTSPLMPKDLLEKLVSAVIHEEGNEEFAAVFK
jgi:hypothetical protein